LRTPVREPELDPGKPDPVARGDVGSEVQKLTRISVCAGCLELLARGDVGSEVQKLTRILVCAGSLELLNF
jgi:hypothetical protein